MSKLKILLCSTTIIGGLAAGGFLWMNNEEVLSLQAETFLSLANSVDCNKNNVITFNFARRPLNPKLEHYLEKKGAIIESEGQGFTSISLPKHIHEELQNNNERNSNREIPLRALVYLSLCESVKDNGYINFTRNRPIDKCVKKELEKAGAIVTETIIGTTTKYTEIKMLASTYNNALNKESKAMGRH